MGERYALLPCNGLDKAVGPLAREVALALVAAGHGELVCPVLLRRAPNRYAKVFGQLPLFVIDGCNTRCASRLAGDQGLRIDRKLQIAEAVKASGVTIEEALTPGPQAMAFCQKLAAEMLQDRPVIGQPADLADFSGSVDYNTFTHDKFLFRVPKDGYYFNENDCWVRVSGRRARVGISDYMQQSLSDITCYTPPFVGDTVEQFGEVGTVESTKAVFEVVSPASGKIVAINSEVVDAPEIINEDPYERGWLVEIELTDFASEQEFLLDGDRYLDLIKRKAADFRG